MTFLLIYIARRLFARPARKTATARKRRKLGKPALGAACAALVLFAACGSQGQPASRAAADEPRLASTPDTGDTMALDTSLVLHDFARADGAGDWRIVNDGVMGGVSRSEMRVEAGAAVFAGTVSPENNGGFASVRTIIAPRATAGATAFTLRVRGDGKTYQFRARTNDRFDSPAYKHEFRTEPGVWVELELPIEDFVATFRGQRVRGAPALDPAAVRQVGVLIADGQYGPFRLEVERIGIVR